MRALALRFTGWCLWYGVATGRWWALSPVWCRQRIGLIDTATLGELAVRIQRIEDSRPHLAPCPRPVRRSRPVPGTGREAAFPAPRPRVTEDTIERSDEGGGTASGHAHGRVR
ncbi:hypothetical protein GCM10017600_45560 [Streptosporangium carneum]|uniref:Uncharacterized protein n=1 Tax=Streptosporangium carneum TaxID=47481 RepID=A0A9W6I569_9ACTN|nr:hypothetical protein GCM10017600_45560 [Streptosporangium carneum]